MHHHGSCDWRSTVFCRCTPTHLLMLPRYFFWFICSYLFISIIHHSARAGAALPLLAAGRCRSKALFPSTTAMSAALHATRRSSTARARHQVKSAASLVCAKVCLFMIQFWGLTVTWIFCTEAPADRFMVVYKSKEFTIGLQQRDSVVGPGSLQFLPILCPNNMVGMSGGCNLGSIMHLYEATYVLRGSSPLFEIGTDRLIGWQCVFEGVKTGINSVSAAGYTYCINGTSTMPFFPWTRHFFSFSCSFVCEPFTSSLTHIDCRLCSAIYHVFITNSCPLFPFTRSISLQSIISESSLYTARRLSLTNYILWN